MTARGRTLKTPPRHTTSRKKNVRAARVPSKTAKAYTAGIIDGEGSISLVLITTRITKSGRPATAPKLVIQVSNTNVNLIRWLVNTWRMGSVAGPYQPRRATHKAVYCWRVRGPTAAKLLHQVLPFLIIKREQAKLGLRAAVLAKPCRKLGDKEMAIRMVMREEMLLLNQRGVSPTSPSSRSGRRWRT